MKTFSKRYGVSQRVSGGLSTNRQGHRDYVLRRSHFLNDDLRARLTTEISHIISTGEYLEPFLLRKHENSSSYVLNSTNLDKLSSLEIGYDISKVFSASELVPLEQKLEDESRFYDDYKTMDFIEILITFSLSKKRDEVVGRIQRIFSEENAKLLIYGHMIVKTDSTGLRAVSELISDPTIQENLKNAIDSTNSTIFGATEAANITQRLFSGTESGKDTKKNSEEIVKKISKRWIKDSKDRDEFEKLLNSLVKNIKSLNNQIKNIRHTDLYTIEFEAPDIFKMVRNLNLAIDDLVLLTLQDKYIVKESPDEMKDKYMKNYKVLNEIELVPAAEDPVDLSDIPF